MLENWFFERSSFLKHDSLSTCYFHRFQLVLVYSPNKYYSVPTVESGEVLGMGDEKAIITVWGHLPWGPSWASCKQIIMNYENSAVETSVPHVTSTETGKLLILQREIGREVSCEEWELVHQAEKTRKAPSLIHSVPNLKLLHPVCPMDTWQHLCSLYFVSSPGTFIVLDSFTLHNFLWRFSLTSLLCLPVEIAVSSWFAFMASHIFFSQHHHNWIN